MSSEPPRAIPHPDRPHTSDLDAPTLKLNLMADKKTHLLVRDVSNLSMYALPQDSNHHRKHILPQYLQIAETYKSLLAERGQPVTDPAAPKTVMKRVGSKNDPSAQYDSDDEVTKDPAAEQRQIALFLHRIPSLVTMGLVPQPRWCTLINHSNVSNVLVIYVNGVSYDEIAGCEVSKTVQLPWADLTPLEQEQQIAQNPEAEANKDDGLFSVSRRLNTKITDRILKPLRANKCSAVTAPEYAPVWVQSTQDNLEQEFFFRSMTTANRRPGQQSAAPQALEDAESTPPPPPPTPPTEAPLSKSAQALAYFKSGKHTEITAETAEVEEEEEPPHTPAEKDPLLETTLANMLHTLAASPSTLKSGYDRYAERYSAHSLTITKKHRAALVAEGLSIDGAAAEDSRSPATLSFYEWAGAHIAVANHLRDARASGALPKNESILRNESGNLDNLASNLFLWTTGLITFVLSPTGACDDVPYMPAPIHPLSFNTFYNAPEAALLAETCSVDSIGRLSGALEEQVSGTLGVVVGAKLEGLGFVMSIPRTHPLDHFEEGRLGDKRPREDDVPHGWVQLHMPVNDDPINIENTCPYHVKNALDDLDSRLLTWITAQTAAWSPGLHKLQELVGEGVSIGGVSSIENSVKSNPANLLAGLYCFAFDCEMVQGRDRVSLLARATLVHVPSGFVLVDALFKPDEDIVDFVTRFSGITPKMLDAPLLPDTNHPPHSKCINGVQVPVTRKGLWKLDHLQQLFQLLLVRTHARKRALLAPWKSEKSVDSTVLVNVTKAIDDCSVCILGHSLENDFKAAKIAMGCSPASLSRATGTSSLMVTALRIVDTSFLYPHPGGHPYKNALRFLTQTFLRKRIQQGSHDSLEDAGVCAELALLKMLKGVEHGSSHRKQHIVHSIPVTLKSFPLALMKGSPNLFAHPAALSNNNGDQQPVGLHAVLPSLVTPSLINNGHASLLTYVPVAHTVIVDRRSALRKVATDCSRRNVATVKDGSNKITDSQEIAKGGCVEESLEKRNVHTPLYYGEEGHDRKPTLWSEGVPPQPISGGDVDAVAKVVKELSIVEASEDTYYSACKKWQLEITQLREGYSTGRLVPPPPPPAPPKPRFLWVQLSTTTQEFDSTASSNEAAHITAVERLNARVLEIVEAAPQHTLVVVVTANCKEGNGNKFSKAHGAMFAFSRAPKTEADISGTNDTSCQSYLKGINSSSSAGCQHA